MKTPALYSGNIHYFDVCLITARYLPTPCLKYVICLRAKRYDTFIMKSIAVGFCQNHRLIRIVTTNRNVAIFYIQTKTSVFV